MMLLLLLVNCVNGFSLELMHNSHKYQVKPHSSLWFSAISAASVVHRSHFFRLYQQFNLFESKLKFEQVSNHWKRVLEAAKLAYGNKIAWLLGLLANCYSVFSKGRSTIPPQFNSPEVFSSASDRVKLFAKNLSENSNFDDSGISLPVFL